MASGTMMKPPLRQRSHTDMLAVVAAASAGAVAAVSLIILTVSVTVSGTWANIIFSIDIADDRLESIESLIIVIVSARMPAT